MKEKTSIVTANAQGIIVPCKNGKLKFLRYEDTYQSKFNVKTKEVVDTVEKVHLNFVQRQMYRKLMYGLKEYTPQQISIMSPQTITEIVENYKKSTRVLHIMKSKKFYKNETDIIRAIFPSANIGEKDFDWLLELPKNATLKKLGISTIDIIDEFIKKRLLPKNFYKLTSDSINL